MPYLSSVLRFAPGKENASCDLPPARSHVVVTDEATADGSWVLAHFLQSALRARPSSRDIGDAQFGRLERGNVVWVGCNGAGEQHCWQIAKKAGINLRSNVTVSNFKHLDTVDYLSRGPAEQTALLSRLAGDVAQAIASSFHGPRGDQAETAVIIDDLSALAWCIHRSHTAGGTIQLVSRFLAQIQQACYEHNACLVSLHHASSTSLSSQVRPAVGSISSKCDLLCERMLRRLLREADLWIEIRALRSGLARDCTGEVAIHPLVYSQVAATDNHHETSLQTLPTAMFAESSSETFLYHITSGGSSTLGKSPRPYATESTSLDSRLPKALSLALRDSEAALKVADGAIRTWSPGSSSLVP